MPERASLQPCAALGFAWDPHGDGKTALRGGYGIFFEHTNGNEANEESLEGNPPGVLAPSQYNVVGYSNVGSAGGSLLFPLLVTSVPSRVTWP